MIVKSDLTWPLAFAVVAALLLGYRLLVWWRKRLA
jgi:hypothetical protein